MLGDDEDTDVVLPVARGYRQPLAAAYRVSLAARPSSWWADRLRPAFLFDDCVVEQLDDEALKQDPVLAALDPDLESVVNVNTPADYQAARARPAPEVIVRLFGTLARAAARATARAARTSCGPRPWAVPRSGRPRPRPARHRGAER